MRPLVQTDAMAWTAQYLPDLAVIETRYTGALTPPELKAAAVRTLELVRENSRRPINHIPYKGGAPVQSAAIAI